ncbi:MAG TPA: dihydrolipoamide acetyltransferase family protein [Mycobacterium sp.]|nr:dihydrolipoamide acetyltransferase family protein [Mycobacterium sp.]
MSTQSFRVPDLGEGLEDVTLTGWAVDVGDEVELNQTLCSVETAKAEVEIPSPYAGRVVERCGDAGDVIPVGAVLIRIDTESAPPQGRNPVLVGYGTDDAMDASRRTSSPRPRAAPAVRKLAKDLHVDLAGLQPSTRPNGVISRDDVLASAGGSSGEVTRVTGVRARMAERMTLSRSRIPDAHASVEVDGSRLTALSGVPPFVMILRMLTLALTRHLVLNSTWVEDDSGPQVHVHPTVNLGVAVATTRGLLVPVVKDAQSKTTRELASSVAALIDSARDGSIAPADLQGSTFTVSNFGALGLDDGVPVINYPEAAILGVGSLKPRPVAVDGAVVVRPTVRLTCAFDHRIADGAQVAEFLCELRQLIESPETALLDL